MGGTATNKGSQDIQFKYYDPLNSDHFDKRNRDILPVGVYKGGLIDRLSNVSVSVNPLTAEISDGVQQARITTSVAYTLAVAPATPYIILSWDWQSISAWYMDIKAVALTSIAANDIVIGKCNYTGSTLNYVEYPIRAADANGLAVGKSRFPNMLDRYLKVEALASPALDFFVNGGWVSFGPSRVPVDGMLASRAGITIVAPVAGYRIDIVHLSAAGAVLYETGSEVTHLPPSHLNKIVLAEIRLEVGATTITDAQITDCRGFINMGNPGGLEGVISSLLTMGA